MLLETLQSFVTGGAAGALVAWVAQHIFAERIRAAVQHEYATKLEDHKAQIQSALAARIERVRGELSELERLNRERWNLKREACLSALGVVDKVLTNIVWSDPASPGVAAKITRSPVDPSEARDTMNRLILACNDPAVVLLFLKCIGLQESGEAATGIDPREVQNLRNAIRRELGFGADLQLNPNLHWILSVHGDGVVDLGAP